MSWRVSIALETYFCFEAVDAVPTQNGKPDVFSEDQGSQFASADFTDLLLQNEIATSTDDRETCKDHAFVKRLWLTAIGRYLDVYNTSRPHSRLVCHYGRSLTRSTYAIRGAQTDEVAAG